MINKKFCLVLAVFLQIFSSESLLYAEDPGDTLILDNFYEQNGDCYLLIGNKRDTSKAGVYQLNNLIPGASVSKLYNPGDAYGITAGIKTKTGGGFEKDLYTFVSKNRSTRPGAGRITTRPMLTTWSYGTWQSDNNTTPNNVAPSIVHRYHTLPNDASTGVGNHTSSYGLYKFNNKCIPCSIRPVQDGFNDDGEPVYKYKIGEEWYHTVTHPAYSRYTYCTKGTSSRFASTGFTDIWMNDDQSTRNANDPDWYSWSTRYGGWVHYVAREDVTETIEKLWLQTWIIGSGFDTSAEKYITDVVVGSSVDMDLKGECIDGCISDVDDIELPGEPAPHLDTAYSALTGASYVYTRNRGVSDGTIEGLQTGDQVIGERDHITTKFVGISSKTNTSNYVYLLGSNVINNWISSKGSAYSSYLIQDPEDLADVAVSDQWWQNGGIVYAYDKRQKKVFCFTRNENTDNFTFDIYDAEIGGTRLPDKIGADGFANLFLMKTDFIPNTNDPVAYFSGPGKNEMYAHSISGYDRGRPVFRAFYKQRIVKSVYKLPYGILGAVAENIANNVPIDENIYTRDYQTLSDTWNDPARTYVSLVQPYYEVDDLSSDFRSELAVINSPTPPRPDHVKAVCDCNGPMIFDPTVPEFAMANDPRFGNAYVNSEGYCTSDNQYCFMVENSPYFNSNLLNVGNAINDELGDKDHDTKVGRFPNTIKKESIKYYWQIRRIKDRNGNAVDEYAEENQILDDGSGNHIVQGTDQLFFPTLVDRGEYKVGVKVTYRFYDYSKLRVGALASEKEECLSEVLVASAPPALRSEDEGFSWETIKFLPVPPPPSPDGDGVIMTYADDYYMPGEGCNGINGLCNHSPKHPQCENTEYRKDNPVIPTFILDGHTLCEYVDKTTHLPKNNTDSIINWGIKLRENTYNKKTKNLDRIDIICGEPPDPNDPAIVEGSLRWQAAPLSTDGKTNVFTVEWKSELVKNGNVIFTKTIPKPCNATNQKDTFKLTLGEVRQLFPISSEPMCYTLTVSCVTNYEYKINALLNITLANGSTTAVPREVKIPKSISIKGTAKVCVTDNQKPDSMIVCYDVQGVPSVIPGYAMKYKSGDNFVKAATGERITDTDSGKEFEFYVADNNPFANYSGSPDCPRLTKDAYHYSADTSSPKNRLIINHNKANQTASLYHQRFINKFAKDGDKDDDWELNLYNAETLTSLLPEDDEVSNDAIDFKNLIYASKKDTDNYPKPTDSVVFKRYKFNANNFRFSNDATTGYPMPFDYASNKSGYKNPTFGIMWRETCWSSNNPLELTGSDFDELDEEGRLPVYRLGRVVSIDNDRPNIFIEAKHEKMTDSVDGLPSVRFELLDKEKIKNDGVIATYTSTGWDKTGTSRKDIKGTQAFWWFPTIEYGTSGYTSQGPDTWDFKSSDSPQNYFNYSYLKNNSEAELTRELFVDGNRLLADIPVTFKVYANDNSGSITFDSFYIKTEKGDIYAGCKAGDDSIASCPYFSETDGELKIQCVFRERADKQPERYYVEATVRDNAMNYPSTGIAEDAETIVDEFGAVVRLPVTDPKPNLRKIIAYFTVHSSRLDYRILDRDIKH